MNMTLLKKNCMGTIGILLLLIFTLMYCDDPTAVLQVYNLTIQVNGTGTTNPTGTIEVNNGKAQSINALFDEGYNFAGWEVISGEGVEFGDETSENTTVTLTRGDATIQANIAPDECLLLITAGTGGTTDPAPDVAFPVSFGVPVDIEAIPDTNYAFSSWSVTAGTCSFGAANDPTTTVTVSSATATIHASFTQDAVNLTITTSGNGTTDPTGTTLVAANSQIPIEAIPDSGWIFDSWEVTAGSGCSFGNSTEASTYVILTGGAATIQANFLDNTAPSEYSVEINQPYIDDSTYTTLSFTYSGAEIGTTYHYSIDDPGNGATVPVTGSGSVTQASATVSGINVSSLDDSTLTLTFYLSDSAGNNGSNEFDTVYKDVTDVSILSVTHGGADDYYRDGETFTINIDMGEIGLTVTADLSVLDSAFSSAQTLTDDNDNTYSFTTAAMNSVTMAEDAGITIYVEATDSIHTASRNYLSLTLDKTDPSGSFVVNNGHNYTPSGSVTINSSVTDDYTLQMRFGDTLIDVNSASWEDYASSRPDPWPLPGGAGLKTIYGQFRDEAENIITRTDTITVIEKLTAFDGAASDNFGYSIAASSDGSTIVVGANMGDGPAADTGAVYVYYDTDWGEEQKLSTGDGAADDRYGYSVDVSADGSVIVIGAYQDDDNGDASGSVYVCYGAFWATVVKLTASDGVAGDNFGYSVAISGDGNTVVVGASGDDDNGTSSGSVYVYNGTNWGTETKLTTSDGAAGDLLGRCVAVSSNGSIVVSGASYDDDNGTSSGSVYAFSGSSWGTQTKLTASDGAASDQLGCSVAISADGSTIVAGAYYDDDNGSSSGSAYAFSGSSWGTQTKLTASDGAASDYFGRSASVSSNGSTICIGADRDNDYGTYSGSAYVYSGSSWSTETKVTPYDGAGADYFGFSVAISSDGSTLAVGAYGDDDLGATAGSAYAIPLE
jgi:hypothetical protein